MKKVYALFIVATLALSMAAPAAAENVCDRLQGSFKQSCYTYQSGEVCQVSCDGCRKGETKTSYHVEFHDNNQCHVVHSWMESKSFWMNCDQRLKNTCGTLEFE